MGLGIGGAVWEELCVGGVCERGCMWEGMSEGCCSEGGAICGRGCAGKAV